MFRLIALLLILAPTLATAAESRALELYDSGGCRGCHQLKGVGGKVGPPLDKIGRRFDSQQLRLSLVAPAALRADTRMPAYNHLPPDEIELLVKFMSDLK